MVLRRRIVAFVGDLEMDAHRDRHRVERGSDIRGRRRHTNSPAGFHPCSLARFDVARRGDRGMTS
jgi:hypothetical protein